MKKNLLVLSFTFFILLLVSCNENPMQPNNSSEDNFKYPYSINSFWYYKTRNFVTNLRPDSLSVYFKTDTTVGFGDSKFSNDTMINNETLRVLRNSHYNGSHGHTTVELFNQTDTGLIRVAFYSDGANFGPHRPNDNSIRYSVNKKIFSSIEELFSYYKNDFDFDNSNDTALIFDSPPVVAIKYPITLNTEWLFKNVGTTKFTKKYLNFENVKVQSGSHYCIKIQKIWCLDNSLTPEPNLIHYDYFAKEGMVKRDFKIKDIAISNSMGNIIGYVDAKEEAELNIYTLP